MFECAFCGRVGKNSISNKNHERRCRENPNRILERKTEDGLRRIRESAKKQNSTMWTEEFRQKHSRSMKKAVLENPDSYTKNNVCGRVKLIEYNGVKLKGQWEVDTAVWLDSQNIKWENESNPQPYFWNNGWHLYFPDFYIPEHDVYIEVKGYKTERDEAKWSQFKGDLFIVDSNVVKQLNDITFKKFLTKCKYAPVA